MLETSTAQSISRWWLIIYLRWEDFRRSDFRFSKIDISSSKMMMRWRRKNLRFDIEKSRDISKSEMAISHACKNLVSQMLHLHFLLHEARLLSSEEQKEVDGKPWGGEKLPSGLGIGLHKSETKKSKERNEKCSETGKLKGNCTERKQLQVYTKDNRKGYTARKRTLHVLVQAL